ncbi:MAG: ECF-type sigma factor [Planctomycetota bacterium]|jgi:RNA polymerase sigma factor (TIGR02999 family)
MAEQPDTPPTQVTRILADLGAGDPRAARDLLPLVYEELRTLAHARMAHEPAGLTLQPTALVHEAYLRLVGEAPVEWNGRGHFFGAAAEAMRRILVERARKAQRLRHGGGRQRLELDDVTVATPSEDLADDEILLLDEAMARFEADDPQRAAVAKLRYFAGLSMEQTADALGVSRATVARHWTLARAWLRHEMRRAAADRRTE